MLVSAALFPRIVAGIVLFFAVSMVVNAVKESGKAKSHGEQEEKHESENINIVRVAVFVALCAAYVFSIPRVGYFIATPLFMVVTYLYLKAAGVLKALAISAGFCIFIYLLFVWFLKLPIPMGLLEPILGN